MNSTRIVVFAVLGLLLGILIGFGFRGSIANILDLGAAPPVSVKSNSWPDQYLATDFTKIFQFAERVKLPVFVLLDQKTTQLDLTNLGIAYDGRSDPRRAYFDYGSISGAEMTKFNACLTNNPTKTVSECLITEILKPRALVKPTTTPTPAPGSGSTSPTPVKDGSTPSSAQ